MEDIINPMDKEKEERELLDILYEAQEKMEPLIDGGKNDDDFKSFQNLIKRLENYITDKNQMLI